MPNLLIVDDSAITRKMIMAALRPLHPTFVEANTGLEAIEQLTIQPYDAVTLDLNMPDMHGMEFLRFVRNMKMMKKVPILIISTRSDAQTQEKALKAGADLFISKPFDPQDLYLQMRSLLKQKESLH